MLTPTLNVLRFVGRNVWRRRQDIAAAMRAGGAAFVDEAFARETRIPALPDEWRSGILSEETLLPPSGAFERGNQDLAGLAFLVSLARWLRARSVFEIGTYNGLTASCLARNVDGATVWTLDIPAGVSPVLPLDPGDELHLDVDPAPTLESDSRVRFLSGDSGVFDFEPYAGTCELVYVDGAHSFEYVVSDSTRAFALLRERAAIVWDDYRRGRRGVVAALDQLAEREQLYRVPGTRLVVYFSPAAARELGAARD